MGDKYYIMSMLERLQNAEKYINWNKFQMDKSPLKKYIKMCQNLLKKDLEGANREKWLLECLINPIHT